MDEISDAGVIEALASFYQADLKARLINEVTGAGIAMPTETGTLAQLLSFAIFDPEVALVWGSDIAFSQLAIWTPYILNSNRRFAVISKSLKNKKREDISLENVGIFTAENGFTPARFLSAAPALSTLLYITDKNENFSYIRGWPTRLHVFANHGDSDKHSNMSRLSTVYDYVMVADRNAAERFIRNGIQLTMDRFLTIGGSVIDGVVPMAADAPAKEGPLNVLYAPTWEGYGETVNFSSLRRIGPILKEFAEAGGALHFRPHPGLGKREPAYSRMRKALASVAGTVTTVGKAEEFNWSDVVIADISGVLSEYLYTRKPIVIPCAKKDKWLSKYIKETSLPQYTYVWDYTKISLTEMLEKVALDPRRAARVKRREEAYYGAESQQDSVRLFNEALDYLEATRRFRDMKSLRSADLLAAKRRAAFQAEPESAELRDVVARIRAGTLVLVGPRASV